MNDIYVATIVISSIGIIIYIRGPLKDVFNRMTEIVKEWKGAKDITLVPEDEFDGPPFDE